VPTVCWATPLYEFLRQCLARGSDRRVLDCGAGGSDPPLALFHAHGFQCFGVEIAEKPLAEAQQFCQEQELPLRIVRGDMRDLPFPDGAFPCVYTFNAIFFMTKPDIARAMAEIERVLAPGGLCYVNFMSADDPDLRPFSDTAPARRLLGSETWAHHADDEPDAYFRHFVIQRKEKRVEEKRMRSGRMLKQVYLEYIAQKC
jgi:ubiquinone/menaquinone biosynthesis C-methylase UbiE